MADENSSGSTTDVVETAAPAEIPAPKKQRAPRRPKAIAEASATPLVKARRGRKKRSEQGVDAKQTSAETQVAGNSAAKDLTKGTRKKRAPKQAERSANLPLPAMDEMADLIQLEEENKRLRKTLADKLRAENADLRKRLGLD
ncbi:UNVERIFIED_ORG: pyruvate/2-oxoglutarate dehydrogenase complex dihydrolipoamide acyltransferase (E2) component [Ensifer adhaerens]|nr:pyruvate/2-oxoglutarate dehydrogenase complex dihydrolipoamide acyltransferase (E2) component [Ensifer adhaerens]